MAEDDTVTTDGIAAGRMLRNPTTTIHVGDSTDGEVQGGDGIEIFDLGSGTDTAGARSNFNIILGGMRWAKPWACRPFAAALLATPTDSWRTNCWDRDS